MSTSITLSNGNVYNLVALPAYPGLDNISVTFVDAVAVVSSPWIPSQTQTQATPGADAWSIEFTLPKMNRWVASPWRGLLGGLRGMMNVLQIGDPFAAAGPLGVAEGAPVCNTTGTNNLTSATQLYTSGWVPNVFGQLKAGDYLQIAYRLHECTEDVNSDAEGNATISIWPSLRESPPNLTAITLTGCVGLFRLAANTRAWHGDFTGLTQISFKLSEVR